MNQTLPGVPGTILDGRSHLPASDKAGTRLLDAGSPPSVPPAQHYPLFGSPATDQNTQLIRSMSRLLRADKDLREEVALRVVMSNAYPANTESRSQ